MELEIIVLVSILAFIASFMGTVTGFGASTMMVPFIALLFPLPITLLFVGVIHLFNDLWKILLFKQGVKWKLLLTFALPGVLASIWGARITLETPQTTLSMALGVTLVVYSLFILLKSNFVMPHSTAATAGGGFLSGFLAGIFGIGGPVRTMFLSAYGFKKEVYIFTSGATAIFIDASRIATYIFGGVRLEGWLLWGMAIFIPVSFAAAEAAKYFVNKIPQEKFRAVIAIFLFAAGVKFIIAP